MTSTVLLERYGIAVYIPEEIMFMEMAAKIEQHKPAFLF
jgi:hypothetical protein